MNKVIIIISAVILILVAIFAMMNNAPVTVNLIGLAEIKSTVALLILVCFASGIVVMALFDLGRQVRSWRSVKDDRNSKKTLEEERDLLRGRVNELTRQLDERGISIEEDEDEDESQS